MALFGSITRVTSRNAPYRSIISMAFVLGAMLREVLTTAALVTMNIWSADISKWS